jgi:hypothetical protein
LLPQLRPCQHRRHPLLLLLLLLLLASPLWLRRPQHPTVPSLPVLPLSLHLLLLALPWMQELLL